jgi:uncharacterized repeat protein (TIGR01451 family)
MNPRLRLIIFLMFTMVGSVAIAAPGATDLNIAVSDSPDPVAAGETLTFSIAVLNEGPNKAVQVVVTDILPPQVTVASMPGFCAGTSTLICTIGNLNVNETSNFDVVVTVDTGAVGLTISNHAEVSANNTETDTSDNAADNSTFVACPVLALNPNSLPDGVTTVAYGPAIITANGTDPTTFAVTNGALPPVLNLSTGGTLSGTPTTPGTYGFTITATDVNTCTGSHDYVLDVNDASCPAITFVPDVLSDGRQNAVYNVTIVANNAAAPVTFALFSGALPAGLALDSAGNIAGTPTAMGSASFVVQATDNNGCVHSQQYTLLILPPCLYCNDFEDGDVLSNNWTVVKPAWSESGGNLLGNPVSRKAVTFAAPAFAGCQTCDVQASMQTAGGIGNKVWLLAWYVSKADTIEVIMKEEADKWIVKERVAGTVVKKVVANSPIVPNVPYAVEISFDGTQFVVTIDGTPLMTFTPVAAVPTGTVGFQAKSTTGTFDYITVN